MDLEDVELPLAKRGTVGRREECTDEATSNARKVFGFVVEVASYFGP
jgi:hypothetical protein